MIIKDNSFIRRPPKDLHPEQAITFNAITYTVDICDISYQRLISSILDISEKPKSEKLIYASIFSDVWTIINNSTIFLNLINKYIPSITIKCKNLTEEFEKAKKIRNSNQHIDERITEIFTSENFPVYGSLWWTRHIIGTDKTFQILLQAGLFSPHRGNISNKMISPQLDPTEEIENINFDYIIREKKDFLKSSLSIKILIENIQSIIQILENSIEKEIEKKLGQNIERHTVNPLFEISYKRM